MLNRPNILVIMSDQHNKHMLGCYGNTLVRTPNLDNLVKESMVFDNAYCPSPLCVPSRMSFMTSRMPSENQVWNNAHILSSAIPTWAHYLGAAGYETTLIGRMHFLGPDQRHGFEKRPFGDISPCYHGVMNPGGWMGDYYPKSACGQDRNAVKTAGKGTTYYQWYDQQVTEKTCQYLKEKSENADKPFAAVMGCVLPHNPFIAPQELFEYYFNKIDVPAQDVKQPDIIKEFRKNRGLLDPYLKDHHVKAARAAYYALCEYFDTLVGKVIRVMKKTGLLDNTIIIYTSDHGELAGEHQCWCKMNYYEGSAGVPLIIRYPKTIKAQRTNAICNLIDLGPTLVSAADAGPMENVAGKTLWPLLTGGASSNEYHTTYSELVDTGYAQRPLASAMIRQNQWKLYEFNDGTNFWINLYDLNNDPEEINDLVNDTRFHDIKTTLHTLLRKKWKSDYAIKKTCEFGRELSVWAKWGEIVKPVHPDSIVMPNSSLESDVELYN